MGFAVTGTLSATLQRVRLRTLREADLAAFFVYRSDPDVARLQGWSPISREEAAELLAEGAKASRFVLGEWTQAAIADVSTDRLIGDLGVYVTPDQSAAEFGITIAPSEQGNGYAAESIRGLIGLLFSTTRVAEITACADVRNASCISALKRAGMRPRETRQAEYKGEVCLEILFSIQRSDGQHTLQSERARDL